MSEQGTQLSGFEDEDAPGLRNRMAVTDGLDEDDVEGHVQPPRGDDTDHVHSIVRQ
jgi:hypothetical protein